MGELIELRKGDLDYRNITARVAEAANDAISQMVSYFAEEARKVDFETLSQELVRQGQKITQAMLQTYLDARGEEAEGRLHHPCPSCGSRTPCKETRQRTIETRHGKITFSRPYFYCNKCKKGFFPLDEELRLAAKAKQMDLGRYAIKLLAEVPYKTASELFYMGTGQKFSDHCMHGLAEDLQEDLTIKEVLPTKEQVEEIVDEHHGSFRRPVIMVCADGAHEPCRPQATHRAEERGPGYWKEAKGFRIYLLAKGEMHHIASWHQIMNEAQFGEALDYAATLIPMEKVRIGAVADGAPWIWSHMERAFPEAEVILDYFHLSENVHKVANSHYKSQPKLAKEWCEATLTRLWFGEVGDVIWGLERMKPADAEAKKDILRLKTYLINNEERIHYDKSKRGNYHLGSGAIESANKFICHVRIKRSGAWWYEENANGMMKIRCAKFNGTLDKIIQNYKNTKARVRKSRRAK